MPEKPRRISQETIWLNWQRYFDEIEYESEASGNRRLSGLEIAELARGNPDAEKSGTIWGIALFAKASQLANIRLRSKSKRNRALISGEEIANTIFVERYDKMVAKIVKAAEPYGMTYDESFNQLHDMVMKSIGFTIPDLQGLQGLFGIKKLVKSVAKPEIERRTKVYDDAVKAKGGPLRKREARDLARLNARIVKSINDHSTAGPGIDGSKSPNGIFNPGLENEISTRGDQEDSEDLAIKGNTATKIREAVESARVLVTSKRRFSETAYKSVMRRYGWPFFEVPSGRTTRNAKSAKLEKNQPSSEEQVILDLFCKSFASAFGVKDPMGISQVIEQRGLAADMISELNSIQDKILKISRYNDSDFDATVDYYIASWDDHTVRKDQYIDSHETTVEAMEGIHKMLKRYLDQHHKTLLDPRPAKTPSSDQPKPT
jgi:hypothetical protein